MSTICYRCHRPIARESVEKNGHYYHPRCADKQWRALKGRELKCECGRHWVAQTNYNNGCPRCAEIYSRTCDGRSRHMPVGTAEPTGKMSQIEYEPSEPLWLDVIKELDSKLARITARRVTA